MSLWSPPVKLFLVGYRIHRLNHVRILIGRRKSHVELGTTERKLRAPISRYYDFTHARDLDFETMLNSTELYLIR